MNGMERPDARLPLRVVKVGGSLLDWQELPAALARWLNSQSRATTVLIAGGGALANAIRQSDRLFNLGEETSHELCVEAMGVTARLLASLLPLPAAVITDLSVIHASHATGLPQRIVLDVRQFMLLDEPVLPGTRLLHGWDATSDSIAARVAAAIGADELVLLKSQDPPGEMSLDQLAERGLVDAFFPRAASEFGKAIRLVNLRTFLRARTSDDRLRAVR